MRQLEEDLHKSAHEHGTELLRVYETVARLEAALGEQGLQVVRLEKEEAAAKSRYIAAESRAACAPHRNLPSDALEACFLKSTLHRVTSWSKCTRALTFQYVLMCAQAQELERQASALVAAWNDSTRGAQTPLKGAHLVSALVAMRQHVSKDTPAASPALAPRSSLKSYIGELQSAGGSLIPVLGLGVRF